MKKFQEVKRKMALIWDLSLTIEHLRRNAYENWNFVGVERMREGAPDLVDRVVLDRAEKWEEMKQGVATDPDARGDDLGENFDHWDMPNQPPPQPPESDPWQH